MNAVDPVLGLHRIHDTVYELSGLRTGSVRDQALRACLVVERLAREHRDPLDAGRPTDHARISPNRPLLVVGGGAAGLCAALSASELGIQVVLLEAASGLLTTLASVPTRTIDPTEYDWPHTDWDKGRFPVEPARRALPLPFDRGPASMLGRLWETQFNAWVAAHPKIGAAGPIHPLMCHRVVRQGEGRFEVEENTGQSADAPVWERRYFLSWDSSEVALKPLPGIRPLPVMTFGAALSCVGFGREDHCIERDGITFEGAPFWARDAFAEPQVGLAGHQGRIEVLVSGGGDGAQQDVQRLLTGLHGRDLFERIADVDPTFRKGIPVQLLQQADDEGRRAHAWALPGQRASGREARARWHKAYLEAVDSWIGETSTNADFRRADLAARLMRNRVNMHLTWLPGGDVPSFSYGLNRLLTLIVLRTHQHVTGRPYWCDDFASRNGDKPIVQSGVRLAKVEGQSPHVASVITGRKNGQELVERLGEFDVVVIRHGVKPQPLFGRAPIPEQIVPFGFPD